MCTYIYMFMDIYALSVPRAEGDAPSSSRTC